MKIIMYVSGIAGTILLVFRLFGVFMEFPQSDLILVSGLILLVLVCLPSYFINKYRYEEKMKRIIKSHNGEPGKPGEIEESEPKRKGWEMNNSPYRERKSGLTWGGGNLHGSNASRGKRKPFL